MVLVVGYVSHVDINLHLLRRPGWDLRMGQGVPRGDQ